MRELVLNRKLWAFLDKRYTTPELDSPFVRLRFRKLLTCRRSRGSVLVTEDRITGETKSVRAIDMATSNGGVDDGFPTSVLR